MNASASSIDRLLRERGALQRASARRIVDAGIPWKTWDEKVQRVYLQDPARGERAAHALGAAARAGGDTAAAARLDAWRGIALQRSGSPEEAARVLLDAADALRAAGDPDRAASALVMAIDSLGHAGQIDEALRCAERARRSIRGPRARLWRAVLKGNRANVLRLAGRLEESWRASDASARALVRLGHAAGAAAPRLNAGVALMYAGHLDRARARFESARDAFEADGHADRALIARYNLACLDVRSGMLGEGIRKLGTLADRFHKSGQERNEALCRMDLSDGLRRSGDVKTAAREARAAARIFQQEGAAAEEVEARWLAVVCAAQLDPQEAEAERQQALERSRAIQRPELELRCEILGHDLALRRGETLDGRAIGRLRTRARRLGQEEIAVEGALLAAEAARAGGRRARARRILADLPSVARRHPWLRIATESMHAQLDVDDGDPGSAVRRLRRLTARLDRIRLGLPGAWLRTTFLFEWLDPYLMLVDVLLQRGRAQDRRQAEEVLDALALRRFLQGRPPKGVARRVADRRRRLEDLYDRLAEGSGPTRGLNIAQRGALLDEVQQLEREIADLWRREERRRGARASVGRSAAAPQDGTVVHVWVRSGKVRALRRCDERVSDVQVLARRADLEKQTRELDFHAQRVRLTGSAKAHDAFDDALAHMGRSLLDPLDLPTGNVPVRLVLDARLPDVPWELLPHHGRPLAAGCSFARIPAARMPPRRGRSVRGSTVVAMGARGLPGAWREALTIGRGARLLHGDAATRAAVAEALESRRVVHLAMHGVAAPDAPALGGVQVSDGWFTSADVPERVCADVVSLAACRTGAPPGAPAIAWGALPVTLMRAGAGWVLWTSADVDDETTADLMSGFHPVSDSRLVPRYFGQAIERVYGAQGTLARLLPFRLSGGPA